MPKDSRFDGLSERIDSLTAESVLTRKDLAELRKQSAPTTKVDSPPKEESWIKKYSGWFTAAAFVLGSGFFLKVGEGWLDSRIAVATKNFSSETIAQGKALSEITGQLKEISGLLQIVVQREMRAVAKLPQKEFNNRLDEVKAVFAVARSQRVKAPDETITDSIRSRVADSDEDLDQFWGAAAAVVNYQSASRTVSDLPDCLDNEPSGKGTLKGNQFTHTPLTHTGCMIELDDPRAGALYGRTLILSDLHFERCVIRYKGRTVVIPINPQFKLIGRFVFQDCTFDITIPVRRPPAIGAQLLAKAVVSASVNSFDFVLQRPPTAPTQF